MKKLLLGSLLVANCLYASDSDWYIGLNTGLMNFIGNFRLDDGSHVKVKKSDVNSKPFIIKFGSKDTNENRLEFYYKKDTIDIESHEVFSASTIGLRSEWEILSKKNNMLPYFGIGFGLGKSSSDYSHYDDGTIIEFALDLGTHYKINPNIDISGGLFYRLIINMVSDIKKYDYDYYDTYYTDTNDVTSYTSTGGIEIGIAYHF